MPDPPGGASHRRLRILHLVAALPAGDAAAQALGESCAEVTGMTGAGITLMDGGVPTASIGATNAPSRLIERLQFELGEGPCVDAANLGHPVLAPDLASPAEVRWPAFRGPVLAAGVGAVFGFPMVIGAAKVGALNLHRSAPGPLTDEQHADALVMAEVAALVVIEWQAGAPAGEMAAELATEVRSDAVVHQATGMVAAQLGIGVAQALVRLRAFAFAHDQPIHEIARQVVGGSLQLDEPDGPPP